MICLECDRQATYSHIEDTETIYSCEHHCCSACTALDGARDSLMATLTALRDRLREQHLHGADDLDAAIERLAAIQRVRDVINEGRKHRGWGYDDDYDSGWYRCANDVERALVVVPDE